jgi:hypothetical protein
MVALLPTIRDRSRDQITDGRATLVENGSAATVADSVFDPLERYEENVDFDLRAWFGGLLQQYEHSFHADAEAFLAEFEDDVHELPRAIRETTKDHFESLEIADAPQDDLRQDALLAVFAKTYTQHYATFR